MHTFFVAPANYGTGLTSVSLALIQALESKGLKVGFLKPIAQNRDSEQNPDHTVDLVVKTFGKQSPKPLSRRHVEQKLGANEMDILLEDVVSLYQQVSHDNDVVIVEGIVPTLQTSYAPSINTALVRSFGADVILVAVPKEDETVEELIDSIEIQANSFGGPKNPKVLGVVFNKVKNIDTFKSELISKAPHLFNDEFRILACNPYKEELNAPRVKDIAKQLNATIINPGCQQDQPVKKVVLCACTVSEVVPLLESGVLAVIPSDREEVMMAVTLAAMSGIPLAGILLCGSATPNSKAMDLCVAAFKEGLPILSVKTNSYETASNLAELDKTVAIDDADRAKQVAEFVAEQLDKDFLIQRSGIEQEARLSPPAFRYQLVKRAQEANKRVVLPEGNEPRTIHAAIICQQRNIARCVLLAKPEEVHNTATALGLQVPSELEIIDPESIRSKYIAPLVEMRKSKGMTPELAEKSLQDTVMLGTMMLAKDDVDGLVSGAVHTTASTVRPALQLIKTAPQYDLVSSVFFMLLPDQVLVYGDCAINPSPSAQELADIAIQSAESAIAFGIAPRIAMLSYSTGSSGTGDDVEKVKEATRLAKEKRPDLLIDGPLQYDAATTESVAKLKAPGSPVAGKATVFIFPDLNTGNTTYKAVQRSAQVISVGPMLQGLRKPVNDLSRGALVEDIVFTIALTAIQAAQTQAAKK